ncbi:MAG: GNAT family N-acetyltransferase [Chromatiales bacterium]|nr:GNAT family N-acetyltransferase [Chromatiales bacterium]
MLKIEQLAPLHDVERFDCGSNILNNVLKKRARKHAERSVSRTYVLTDHSKPKVILGYVTLTLCEVLLNQRADRRMRYSDESRQAAKLARLATSKKEQHHGYGALLVVYAMQRVLEISDHMGLVGLYVDLKDEIASGYYRQFDFINLKDNERTMFLPTESIRKALTE